MNDQETARLLKTIRRLWPTVPMQLSGDPEFVHTWQVVLSDIPFEAAEAFAAVRSRAGDQFPPPPGVIARNVLDTLARVQGSMVPNADEAWQEVRAGIARTGHYSPPPAWSHPAVTKAVAGIGWRELCLGEEMITRAHFLRIYPAIADRVQSESVIADTFAALGYSTNTQIGSSAARELPTASDP